MTVVCDSSVASLELPEVVLGLLREQASMYGRLEGLARAQGSLVTCDDVGPLLSLLADRQKLAERLTHVAGRLAPVRKVWPLYRPRFSDEQRAEADRLVGEAGERLQRVIERDENDVRILSGKKQTVADSLRATQSSRQAIGAYRAPKGETARPARLDEGC